MKDFEQYVLEKSGNPYSYFSVARIVRITPAAVLWVHDENDKICTFSDVKSIANEKIERTEFLVTKGLGHNKIYLDSKVKDRIFKFLTCA